MGRRWKWVAGLLILAAEAHAAEDRGFSVSVLVNGAPVSEVRGRGSVYVEAVRGQRYALRITNPLPYRVAVALSVDGLNTIDARHTDAWTAKKWVLDPHETVTIPGWQVNGSDAREFFFTGERGSYGAWLGKTADLGVIEAVFYREHAPLPVPMSPAQPSTEPGLLRDFAAGGVPMPRSEAKTRADLSDEFAATGMGRRDSHEVYEVSLDLERQPAASVRLRYEFHPQLVRLGVLPNRPDGFKRREAAEGFSPYCPEPSR